MPSSDPTARPRFYKSLVAYAILATLAWTTLDGSWRWFVLILLAGLALKSWVHLRRLESE
jgi:O-antigen ligase